MSEEQIFCPFCGKQAEYIDEDEDHSSNIHVLAHCKSCQTSYTIQTGPDIEEWAKEIRRTQEG